MKLDRNTQRKILEFLYPLYPQQAYADKFPADLGKPETVLANAFYLHEHNLIELAASTDQTNKIELTSAKITAFGIDFLTNDGVLSAVSTPGHQTPRQNSAEGNAITVDTRENKKEIARQRL